MRELTHFNAAGRPRLVDVGAKPVTEREAEAVGRVAASRATLRRLQLASLPKGDVLAVAQLAGIMAAKETGRLIPLCHSLSLDSVELDFQLDEQRSAVQIHSRVRSRGRTGVEMEALTAVAVAALTIYDMCKAVDRQLVIGEIHLQRKLGGVSGEWRWPEHEPDSAGGGRLTE